jgi:lipopolysaccharide heptosyltransferase II
VKLCCIGDVLMATPTLRAVRETYPEAKITVMVASWAKMAIANNPNVDDIIDIGPMERLSKPLTYLGLLRSIKKGRFDTCLVLERSLLITALPFLAGVGSRAGIDSFGRGFALNYPVKWDHVIQETELYLDVAGAIGCRVKSTDFEFHPSALDETVVIKTLESKAIDAAKPLVAIHVGGASNPLKDMMAKRWPAERYAALADMIIEKYNAPVLLLGAASDRENATAVIKNMKNKPVDLVGQLDLGEVAALCRHCTLYIGNDTGVTHLAAAVGTPVIAIFGPTSPDVYKPFGRSVETVWKRQDCSPCFHFGAFDRECSDHRCIEAVTVEDVWRVVERRLDAR